MDVDATSIEQIVTLMKRARDAQTMAEAMLEINSTGKFIPSIERFNFISMALSSGREWAQELRKQYPEDEALLLAHKLGVEVKISDQRNEIDNIVFRSEYCASPPEIVIYNPSINALQEVLVHTGLTDLLALGSLVPVHVAHELFHHLENLKQDFISQRYKVATLRIGRWRLIESGIQVLSEIGAHCFAQVLLNLSWYPAVLDEIERLTKGNTIGPVDRWNKFITK
jgi:hypothetical protein